VSTAALTFTFIIVAAHRRLCATRRHLRRGAEDLHIAISERLLVQHNLVLDELLGERAAPAAGGLQVEGKVLHVDAARRLAWLLRGVAAAAGRLAVLLWVE